MEEIHRIDELCKLHTGREEIVNYNNIFKCISGYKALIRREDLFLFSRKKAYDRLKTLFLNVKNERYNLGVSKDQEEQIYKDLKETAQDAITDIQNCMVGAVTYVLGDLVLGDSSRLNEHFELCMHFLENEKNPCVVVNLLFNLFTSFYNYTGDDEKSF